MRIILLSIVIVLGSLSLASAQKQNLQLVNDIGKVFETKEWQGNIIIEEVLPMLYAKLGRKYKLVKRNQQIDQTLSEMIRLRRQYRTYGDTKALMYRAYDHAIAEVLTPGDSRQTYSQGCQEAEEELARALGRYDRALKNYGKCVNGSSFSANTSIPMMDSLWGGPPASSAESASSGGCQSQLKELERAASNLERMINLRNLACKFG